MYFDVDVKVLEITEVYLFSWGVSNLENNDNSTLCKLSVMLENPESGKP